MFYLPVKLPNEDHARAKMSNFVLYRVSSIKVDYKIFKILYAYLFLPQGKELGRVIKRCFRDGLDLDEDRMMRKKNLDKNNV